MRVAVLRKERCKPEDCNYLCMKFCPKVRSGVEAIKVGEDKKPIINEDLCIGCGICVKKCPFQALSIVNLPDALRKDVFHSYGKNQFRLFKFIVPRKGKVLGLIGENGIGKTTVLNILSGKLLPNLGREKVNHRDILDFFKGSEAMNYFRDLFQGRIKVSYKIQNISEFSRDEKVRDFLEEGFEEGERKEVSKLSSELRVSKLFSRKLMELSGGELQKVLVVKCLSREANVYFLDEPCSYLDIGERLKIARIIRKKLTTDNYLVVVDHDLIFMDLVSDFVQIFYGRSNVYGIISSIYSTRVGINNYIEGYLPVENVKFREFPIKFERRSEVRKSSVNELVKWSDLKKRIGNFELVVKSSGINEKEIVGVIGINGTGKTIFSKLISGLETPDSGEIYPKIKVAYKPQYLKVTNPDLKVRDIIGKVEVGSLFWKQVILPLRVNLLSNLKLSELSGGQLQKIALVECLLREAELYVFDEPSAYLDVEERLKVAKVLRDFLKFRESSALIIDHDLLFIDYTSDRIIYFSGKPAEFGTCEGPLDVVTAMNFFLKEVGVTMRRDKHTNRPRVNKPNSRLDVEQRKQNKYYYV
ncbi:MAG TPA: ribosome biogenesis/translation initiation ATPase RLI [Candidatus Aenigmarchaeota archaeon]|nr:ribosome biogenesis/translation initiation ATPase RLI [Candidatus Aenigmarchaeota archaeon]